MISRALVELFSNSVLKEGWPFAAAPLYKLLLRPAARYSEDIDSCSEPQERSARSSMPIQAALV